MPELSSVAETSRPGRVLLVEDDPAVSAMYRLRLQWEGFEVVAVADGHDALAAASAGTDMIVLDVGLPGLDGLEVLRRLKAVPDTDHIPVMLLSNYSDPAMIASGMGLGAVEYLLKVQVSPADLSHLVTEQLTSR